MALVIWYVETEINPLTEKKCKIITATYKGFQITIRPMESYYGEKPGYEYSIEVLLNESNCCSSCSDIEIKKQARMIDEAKKWSILYVDMLCKVRESRHYRPSEEEDESEDGYESDLQNYV